MSIIGSAWLRALCVDHGAILLRLSGLHLLQRLAQLGTAQLGWQLFGRGFSPECSSLRPGPHGNDGQKHEKEMETLHRSTITPNQLAGYTVFDGRHARPGNICNSVSMLIHNSLICSSKPAKSALLHIQGGKDEPDPQPQRQNIDLR